MRIPAHIGCPCCGSLLTFLFTDNDAYEFLTKAHLELGTKSESSSTGDPGIITARNRQVAFTGKVDTDQLLRTIEALAKVAEPLTPILANWLTEKLKRVKEQRISEVLYCSQCGYVKIS